jgi:chemotaxis protein CheD
MNAPREQYVHPGEFRFAPAPGRLCVVLGSCVALSAWHPASGQGGLCHILVPGGPHASRTREGRMYAEVVLKEMADWMAASALPGGQWQLGLFGGSAIVPAVASEAIGARNIAFVQQWLAARHWTLERSDLGGHCSRLVSLDLGSGLITVKSHVIALEKKP